MHYCRSLGQLELRPLIGRREPKQGEVMRRATSESGQRSIVLVLGDFKSDLSSQALPVLVTYFTRRVSWNIFSTEVNWAEELTLLR